MKMTSVLARLPETELHELARELEIGVEHASRGALTNRIEGVLQSPRHVEHAVSVRRPPVLPLLGELLKAQNHTCPVETLKERSMQASDELKTRVAAGDLLGGEQHGLYRRVLMEAWRTDLSLDASEASLLGVLRKELGMTQVHHFLTAHHPDVERFWRADNAFDVVLGALRNAGIVHLLDADAVLPEELVPRVRDATGLHLESDAYGRLLNHVQNSMLRVALVAFDIKSSGSKDTRLERVVDHYVPPHAVLDLFHIDGLRSFGEEVGAKKSGSKETLIERLVDHFRQGLDLDFDEPEEEEQVEVEPKIMSRQTFGALFENLKGRELSAIFWKLPNLPSSGAKSKKIETLWSSHLNAESLLSLLGGRALYDVLERLGLRTSGSKLTKARRLVDYGNTLEPVPEAAVVEAARDEGP